jgi:hypothetical protein
VQGRILEGFEAGEGRPLLVDVGGGKGHDLQVFWERFCRDEEGMRGELVLQELGSVIEGIREEELDGSVKRMEYDFFMEQPVKGMSIHPASKVTTTSYGPVRISNELLVRYCRN